MRPWFVPAFSRSVGYLGHAWCRSDSQILARNGVFVVTVACKSKTTQSALCLDEASAECQARTPRKRRMRIPSVACGISNAHGRNPDTKTQEGLCCDVLLCLQGARPRGARAPRRPLATGCAGGGRPNVRKRGARCTRTPKKRILLRRIAPWPLGPPIEGIFQRQGTQSIENGFNPIWVGPCDCLSLGCNWASDLVAN